MPRSKPLTGFSRYSDTRLEEHAQAILKSLTGNSNFPNPSTDLSTFSAAVSDFQNALSKAAIGNRTNRGIKDQSRAALISLLQRLGLYVEQTADGDAAKILSSGFKVKKHPSHTRPLSKPSAFEVKAIGKGEIKLRCERMKNARVYCWEYKQTTSANWLTRSTTKASILLTGLESGKEYFFHVAPIGTSDIREYSDTISSFVL